MAKINGLLLVFCVGAMLSVGHAFWPFTSTPPADGKSNTQAAVDWTKDQMPDKKDIKNAAQVVADKTKDAAQGTSDFAAKKGGQAKEYLANSPRYSADSPRAHSKYADSPLAHSQFDDTPEAYLPRPPHSPMGHKEHHSGHPPHAHPPQGAHPPPHHGAHGSPKSSTAGSPKHAPADSPMPSKAGSPNPAKAGSPKPAKAGSPGVTDFEQRI